MNTKQNGINIVAALLWLALGVLRIVTVIDSWKLVKYASGADKALFISAVILETVAILGILLVMVFLIIADMQKYSIFAMLTGIALVLAIALRSIMYIKDGVKGTLGDWKFDMALAGGLISYIAFISSATVSKKYARTDNSRGWIIPVIVYLCGLVFSIVAVIAVKNIAAFYYYMGFKGVNKGVTISLLSVEVLALFFTGFYTFMLSKKPYSGVTPAMRGVPAPGANSYAPFNRDLVNGQVQYQSQQPYRQPSQPAGYAASQYRQPFQPGGYQNQPGGYQNQPGGYQNQQGGYQNQQGGYQNQQGGYQNQPSGYQNQPSGYQNQQSGYQNQQSGYQNQQGGYQNQQGYPQGGYQNQQGGYQNQQAYEEGNFGKQYGFAEQQDEKAVPKEDESREVEKAPEDMPDTTEYPTDIMIGTPEDFAKFGFEMPAPAEDKDEKPAEDKDEKPADDEKKDDKRPEDFLI